MGLWRFRRAAPFAVGGEPAWPGLRGVNEENEHFLAKSRIECYTYSHDRNQSPLSGRVAGGRKALETFRAQSETGENSF